MAISRILTAVIATSILIGLPGCVNKRLMELKTSRQLTLRSIQTRAFDTTEKNKMLRAVIATLQDLGYIVNEANEVIGTVSARTSHIRYLYLKWKRDIENQFREDTGKERIVIPLLITVTVRPRGETQLLVRANAQFNQEAVEDPLLYQNFFTVLEKSIFLTAHEVD